MKQGNFFSFATSTVICLLFSFNREVLKHENDTELFQAAKADQTITSDSTDMFLFSR